MTEMSVEQFRKLARQGVKARMGRSKYGAKPQLYQGIRYASKAELAFELHLRHLRAQGKVVWWTRQVPFFIPSVSRPEDPALKYLCDFLVVMSDNRVRVVDVKGMDTPNSKTKRAVVQATHGLKVEVIPGAESYTWS